jgi:hypothetical protein
MILTRPLLYANISASRCVPGREMHWKAPTEAVVPTLSNGLWIRSHLFSTTYAGIFTLTDPQREAQRYYAFCVLDDSVVVRGYAVVPGMTSVVEHGSPLFLGCAALPSHSLHRPIITQKLGSDR